MENLEIWLERGEKSNSINRVSGLKTVFPMKEKSLDNFISSSDVFKTSKLKNRLKIKGGNDENLRFKFDQLRFYELKIVSR